MTFIIQIDKINKYKFNKCLLSLYWGRKHECTWIHVGYFRMSVQVSCIKWAKRCVLSAKTQMFSNSTYVVKGIYFPSISETKKMQILWSIDAGDSHFHALSKWKVVTECHFSVTSLLNHRGPKKKLLPSMKKHLAKY